MAGFKLTGEAYMLNQWSDEDYTKRMARGWGGGLKDGTPCGSGSQWATMNRIIPEIVALCLKHQIAEIADVGAGDCRIDWPGARISRFDLVSRRRATVYEWDISKRPLPAYWDLAICRHVMIHMDPPRIVATLSNLKESADFLLASTYEPPIAPFNPCWQFNRLDLTEQLGKPLELIDDFEDSKLGLWRLS